MFNRSLNYKCASSTAMFNYQRENQNNVEWTHPLPFMEKKHYKWQFSIVMFVITRGYIPLNPIKPPWNHHETTIFLWFSYGFPMVSRFRRLHRSPRWSRILYAPWRCFPLTCAERGPTARWETRPWKWRSHGPSGCVTISHNSYWKWP